MPKVLTVCAMIDLFAALWHLCEPLGNVIIIKLRLICTRRDLCDPFPFAVSPKSRIMNYA